MKTVIAIVIALAAQASMAQCIGEAQIIAKVETVTITSSTECTVTVSPYSIVQYNESKVCPLDMSDVVNQGIQVNLNANQECSYQAGQDILGVLVKNASGTISLD